MRSYQAILLSLLVLLPSLHALPSASSSSSSEEYYDSSEFGDNESYESLEDGFEVRFRKFCRFFEAKHLESEMIIFDLTLHF